MHVHNVGLFWQIFHMEQYGLLKSKEMWTMKLKGKMNKKSHVPIVGGLGHINKQVLDKVTHETNVANRVPG